MKFKLPIPKKIKKIKKPKKVKSWIDETGGSLVGKYQTDLPENVFIKSQKWFKG